ncbi:hypothetical protein OROHE_026210 [Orobanche hederae]
MGSSNPSSSISLASSSSDRVLVSLIPDELPNLYSKAFPRCFEDDAELNARETFQGKLVCKQLHNKKIVNFINAMEMEEMKTETEALKENLKNQSTYGKVSVFLPAVSGRDIYAIARTYGKGEETIRALRTESNMACVNMKKYVEQITSTTIENLNRESKQRIKRLKNKRAAFVISKHKKNQGKIVQFIDDGAPAICETSNEVVKSVLLESEHGN